ncbi:MAG: hypothetical protein IKK08_12960 [Clostridia bacterium]|nr:hypothetical protein [Clostridia bacterium]
MKKKLFSVIVALALSLCLLVGAAAAESAAAADLEALYPLMDLVCAAGYDPAQGTFMVVPDSEGVLEISFVDSLIRLAQERGVLEVTEATMKDPSAQTALLQRIFAAQLPKTETVVAAEPSTQYIGFKPVTVGATGEESVIRVLGEMYMASKPLLSLSEQEFADVLWLDRAVFTFRADPEAYGGFRLMGFSSGMELSVEEEMQAYSESIVVEYVNTNLGFMLLYPAVFTDDMLIEDANGVSAALPDGSVSFFARRDANSESSTLTDYVSAVAEKLPDADVDINQELCYGAVSSIADGYAVYDVYVVTGQYVYHAQLKYRTDLMSEYSMYNAYLLNSFGVDELAAG